MAVYEVLWDVLFWLPGVILKRIAIPPHFMSISFGGVIVRDCFLYREVIGNYFSRIRSPLFLVPFGRG